MDHTVKAFDEDITQLRGLIAEMGGLAELAISEALSALVSGDETKARQVILRDTKLDELEAEVDAMAVRILALRAPMADDLREIVAALKISGVIERIGDYSKNIAKRIGRIEGRKTFEPLTLLSQWAKSPPKWCMTCSPPMQRAIRCWHVRLLSVMRKSMLSTTVFSVMLSVTW